MDIASSTPQRSAPMPIRRVIQSARFRLTLWQVVIVALLLAAFILPLYTLLRRNFFAREDAILSSVDSATIAILGKEVSESGIDELAARDAVNTLTFPDHTLAIFDQDRILMAEYPVGSSLSVPLPPSNSLSDGQILLYTVKTGQNGETRRVAAVRVTIEPTGRSYFVVTSRSLTPLLGELATDRMILVFAIPGGLLLSGFAGWYLVRKNLAPVLDMSETARRISAENLDERLPISKSQDELGQLASTFNDLLSRLSQSFNVQRQFMADASHELRSPLSVIRTTAGVTLHLETRGEGDYRESLTIIEDQSRRLTRIVEDMFHLAQADAGNLLLQLQSVDLAETLHDVVYTLKVLADKKHIVMVVNGLPEAPFLGDPDALRRMLLNLLGNAVKFAPSHGRISAQLVSHRESYRISIKDNGPGVPEQFQEKIFERFFRVDHAYREFPQQLDSATGAGLGLAIARTIAEAHGGTLTLAQGISEGCEFIVRLPIQK
jgi:two-component system OmpR family sensor kinase